MIEVDKTYSDNPFVDELIYYSKILSLNCVIKDEEEALANETKESLHAGQTYIACVEGRAKFEMFESFPEEILEKYITTVSNLDIMVDDISNLAAYLNSMSVYDKTNLMNKIDRLARVIYIDHYDVMMNYLDEIGPTWLEDNKELYESCKNGTATYKELFDIIPLYTRKRILKQYIRNFDGTDIDELSSSLDKFQEYCDNREEEEDYELPNINLAMRSVFQSHYEIIVDRKYLKKDTENNWWDYLQFEEDYERCVKGEATYETLYNLFPKDDLTESLKECLTDLETQYVSYVAESLDNLNKYLASYKDPILKRSDIDKLNKNMTEKYLANYNISLNFDIYNKAMDGLIGYEKLHKYMPKETNKIILNNFIQEETNISVFAKNLAMLLSYLSSLPLEKAEEIKANITKDMQSYYVANYVELNNYYRTIMGLPPLDDNKTRYEDTLFSTYNEKSNTTIKFDNALLDLIPQGIYPDSHWLENELYEFDNYDISILTNYGVLDKFIELSGRSIKEKRYKYLNYLGDNALDIYTCRKALNFELMSIPVIDNTEVKNMFIDKFTVNRDYVIKTVYTEAHKFQSDYYNKFMIIFILINTIMDVLSSVPKLIIDREIFDSRSIKYLFESFGIPYYSEIPVKYQQAMLKNLNILIKYKSSTKNMIDICSLFGFEDIRVFGYYMLKDRRTDPNNGNLLFKEDNEISYDEDNLFMIYPNGEYTDTETGIKYQQLSKYFDFDKDKYFHKVHVEKDGNIEEKYVINSNINCYVRNSGTGYTGTFIPISESDYFTKIKKEIQPCDVKFIKVPIDEQLTEYKNDNDYIADYDDITLADDTWDGGLLHEKVKNDILDYEFNAVLTKYISVETVTQLTEMAFQVSYFYNMLFDNLYSEENLTVEVPYIKANHKFKFVDIVCYLFALMYLYHGLDDKIMYSLSQILYVKGYYSNEDLHKVLSDTLYFTQTANPMDQENIFSINEAIEKAGYDYNDEFANKRMKAFNLDADMDELDAWLRYNYQHNESELGEVTRAQEFHDASNTLGLNSFIVYEEGDADNPFGREITLWDFYSINNSHYQKELFKNHLLPLPYNQIIKYGFNCNLLEKETEVDLNKVSHEYCVESDELGLIINDTDNLVYIINNDTYAVRDNGKQNIVLYNLFNKTTCELVTNTLYYRLSGEYYPLFNNGIDQDKGIADTEGLIYVKNLNGDYVYAAKKFYAKIDDGNGSYRYEEITDPKYFITEEIIDENGNKVTRTLLNIGDYFESERDENGNFKLHSYNDYVKVYQNGKPFFVLYKDIDKYQNVIVPESEMYVQDTRDDGSIKYDHLLDSDRFKPTGDPEDDYAFIEENCFVISNEPTEYFDEQEPNKFYMRITDYYDQTDYKIDDSVHYVKDANGNYIPVTDLLDPNNCYVMIKDGYYLLIDQYVEFRKYTNPKKVSNVYILNEDNFYDKYRYSLTDKMYMILNNFLYVNESSGRFILAVYTNANYDKTKKMVVVLNKYVYIKSSKDEEEESGIYDPEKTDGVWDENDWFYSDPSYDPSAEIGMNGENKWYYKKPGSDNTPKEDGEVNYIPVGSGFYLEAESYLGNVELEKGEKYFLSMDVECNFEGKVRIACDADSSNTEIAVRMYDTKPNEQFHVSQTFIANDKSKPRIIFFRYNYDEFPINRGDYFIVSNIRIVKSHSANYIPQDIPSYDKLQEIYKINEACYRYLCKKMVACTDYETYMMYQKIYDTLMVSEYNKEMFKLTDGTYAETYTEFLQHRDSVLYEKLVYFKSLDAEAMRKSIADNIIEVTYAIDDCVDTYSYGYLYSYFPAVSASYIQQYICKIIDFFKSWKVHLLGINTIYRFDDNLENTVKILYDMLQQNTIRPEDTVFINDSVKINPVDDVDPDGNKYSDKYDDFTTITHKEGDPYEIEHAIKVIESTANSLRYRDNEVDLVTDNDDIEAYTDDAGNLIISGSDGFSIELPNILMYDEDGNLMLNFNTGSILLDENTNLEDFLNSHKDDILDQALFDAKIIGSLNVNTFSAIHDKKED